MVENFLGVLKSWSQWVVGQSPLPDRRSKIMLGAVLAVGATLAVALIATIGSPTAKGHHHTSQPASIATPLPYSAGAASPTSSTMPAMPAVRTASTAKGAAHSHVGKKATRGAAGGRRHHRNTGLHHPKQPVDREVLTA